MNIQKPTVTEVAVIGVVLVGGFLAWRAWRALPKSVNAIVDTAASTVDQRQSAPDSVLGSAQSWFADTVQKGQDAGASNFVTSFFTGLTK